jgi:RNA polymerase sigma factor (sigma-70 family)
MALGSLGTALRHLRRLATTSETRTETDRQLLRRFVASRAEDAFTELVRRHGPLVLGVCRRLLRHRQDAEDAFQATFLVLARKAASQRWEESVAHWLYEVATRVALRMRSRIHQRGLQEARAAEPSQGVAPPTTDWRDLCAALDEELQRLPAACREPLLLCYWEGETRDRAARRLGLSLRTLDRRLARGRERLRARLERRGLTLPAALLAVGLPAAVPTALAGATVCAAVSVAAGTSAQAVEVSAEVAALTEGELGVLTLAHAKMRLALLAGLLVVGAGTLAYQGGASNPGQIEQAEEPRAEAEAPPVRIDRYGDPLPVGAVGRLGSVRFRGEPRIGPPVFSPDGKLIATRSQNTICLWEAVTGKEVRRWPSRNFCSTILAFSPDGKLLAVNDSDKPSKAEIRLLDIVTGKEVRRLAGDLDKAYGVAFAPDGRVLASYGNDNSVRLWDLANGQELHRLEGHQKRVSAVAIAPDNKLLASAGADRTIRLWDIATGNELGQMTGHLGEVHSVAFAPRGAMLASGGEDNTVRVWDVATGKEIRVLGLHPTAVGTVVFSPDGKFLASGGVYDGIALWDLAAGKELRRWASADGCTLLGGFSPDGRTLASVRFPECAPRFWDVATGREVVLTGGHRSPVKWLAFAPDGRTLTSGEMEKILLLRWDLRTGQELGTFTLPSRGPVRSALSPDGKTLATWDSVFVGGSVRLCDSGTGKELHRLGQHTWKSDRAEAPWCPFAFSPDGKQAASLDHERIVLWDVATGRMVRDFQGLRGDLHCVAFAPDGQTLAAGVRCLRAEGDPSIFLWDVVSGRQLHVEGHGEPAEVLVFSPDGKLLASGSWGFPVRLRDVATGREWLTLAGSEKGVFGLAFSPDGRLLAGPNPQERKEVRLWEVYTGQEACRFVGDKVGAFCVAFAPDGRSVASGSGDSTILLWDVTGRMKEGRLQPTPLRAADLDRLWNDLGGPAAQAHRAIWALVAASGQAVPFLAARLRPVTPAAPQHLARLLVDLDSDRFAVRAQAARELKDLGELSVPALRGALAGQPSLEFRRRAEQLLEGLQGPVTSPARLQPLRAVAALEQVGTPEARQVLDVLAKGTPEARLTQEAKAALRRLAEAPSTGP